MTGAYVPGKGCTCAAWNESECCCDADWTDPAVYELYELREYVNKLECTIKNMHLHVIVNNVNTPRYNEMVREVIGDIDESYL